VSFKRSFCPHSTLREVLPRRSPDSGRLQSKPASVWLSPQVGIGAAASCKSIASSAGRVVDIDEQGASWSVPLKPEMVRPVDLNELAEAVATMTRPMDRFHSLLAVPSTIPPPSSMTARSHERGGCREGLQASRRQIVDRSRRIVHG
jgi:hypothetical protein